MNQEGRKFECYDENGNVVECEVLMNYICDDNHKSYIFYTNHQHDENGDLILYASIYLGEDNGNMVLESITDEKEWELLDKVLEEAKKGEFEYHE